MNACTVTLALFGFLACVACSGDVGGAGDAGDAGDAGSVGGAGGADVAAGSDRHELQGTWRVVLASPGGDLPFTLRIAAPGAEPPAVVINGAEALPFSEIAQDGDRVRLEIEWYDARLAGRVSPDGNVIEGAWTRTVPGSVSRLPFRAVRGDERRFLNRSVTPPIWAPSVAGNWNVTFTEADGATDPARAEFVQSGDRVTGTFLTPTGDYRFLEGTMWGNHLRLSCFDGAHAFLFDAEMHADGSLAGDFWSRDVYHATWTATPAPAADPAAPPSAPFDPWSLVRLTNPEGRLRFSFPVVTPPGGPAGASALGAPLSLADERFDGKVVLVNLFGSWCPNCHDEAPHLARWHARYAERGLEVVALAFEFTGEADRDARQVRRFIERYAIEYPVLLAGMSDKKRAAELLPDLTAVVAYPTTIFVGRDGRVRRIHSGFSGPGTGRHHDALLGEFESLIESLLAEE